MKKQNKKEKAPKVESGVASMPKELTEKVLRFYPLLLAVAVLLVVFGVLLCYESDYLFRVQELNLFLYTPLFFKQQLVVAGGFLTYVGTYFTQFFYHPWFGSLLLCLWCGLLMWLTKRTFAVPNRWAPLLLVPVVLVLLIDFDLGYWLYYLKLRGHFFIAAMGASLAVGLTWVYRLSALRGWPSYLLMVLAGVLAYPVAGCYGLFALLLMAVVTWRLQVPLTQKILATILAVVLLIFVPLVYYRTVYYQALSDNIWWQALPVFKLQEGFSPLYYPYILLGLSLLLLAAFYRADCLLRPIRRRWAWVVAQVVLLLAIGLGGYTFWFKDKSFHEEIQMTACVDRQDWEGVLTVMRNHEGEPTRMMVMYKNLALFRLGRAGDEMYRYRDGSRTPACPFEVRIAQIGGKNIYLYYGLPNYCYRWCLEDGVEFGWRAEHLKFLSRCAILNGEYTVARKYLDLLRQTRYHGEWADHYERLLEGDVEKNLAQDAELGPVRPLMTARDVLASDQSLIELFLLNLLAYRVTEDPKEAELVLLSAMQLKDIQAYWRAFFQYAALTTDRAMPRHFQEAAYLYGHLEKHVDISKMPFDPSVVESYNAFMQMANQCQGMSEERMKDLFYPRFGNTFYYNYFLMRNLRSY